MVGKKPPTKGTGKGKAKEGLTAKQQSDRIHTHLLEWSGPECVAADVLAMETIRLQYDDKVIQLLF
jgi:hypothetical protein